MVGPMHRGARARQTPGDGRLGEQARRQGEEVDPARALRVAPGRAQPAVAGPRPYPVPVRARAEADETKAALLARMPLLAAAEKTRAAPRREALRARITGRAQVALT